MKKELYNLSHQMFNLDFKKITSIQKPLIDIKLAHNDSFPLEQKVHWWYWTGSLKNENNKEFGFEVAFKRWQWFSIELEDNISIMLFDFLADKKEKYGTISIGNQTEQIKGNRFEVKVLDTWKSPNTNINYPSSWKITIDNKTFFIKPLLKDRKLRAKHFFWIGSEFWEGDCTVEDENDNKIGDAYVELNGF